MTTLGTGAAGTQWWRHAVIYQVYPRSWADSDGDGTGDLPGITARLPYLAQLGVDALWLSPFYVSPMHDAGYDVADYCDIDPRFGTLADADRMIATAHDLGLRVIVDLVPNHSSEEHPWFQEALAAGPGSPERARYMFRDGRGPDSQEPPNDWQSVFGGPAWTKVGTRPGHPEADGQWYLHLFDASQPDWDWTNPDVPALFLDVLRFWLDRGVDGFRVDVAHGLVKAPGLPDAGDSARTTMLDPTQVGVHTGPMWDQPGLHDIYRSWRALVEQYAVPGEDRDRILCAEAWVATPEGIASYVRPDEMHQSFNFSFLQSPWEAGKIREVITDALAAHDAVGAPTTWVLSNHDVIRHATRLALPVGTPRPNGIGPDDPQPDAALGLRRARAATTFMLALPGVAYLYQGEELGLPEHTTMPPGARQDPTYIRTEGTELGRDGCRVPFPWARDLPAFGFGPSDATWLPQPEVYGDLAVDQQDGAEGSTLELYRSLLRLRRELGLGTRPLTWIDDVPDGVVAFEATAPGEPAVRVVLNVSDAPVDLPGGEVLAASEPGAARTLERRVRLAECCAVWLR